MKGGFLILKTKYTINDFFHLYNDYIFKRVFNTPDTLALNFLIQSVTCHSLTNLTLSNVESLSQKHLDKRIFQDIRALDTFGNIYNVEMQNSLISSVQEDRFLFTGCKNISGQLSAGQDYQMIKRSETIVFTTMPYDRHLVVSYEMNDAVALRHLKHRKLILYIISLPVIDDIFETKKRMGTPLTDLEILCLALRKGINEMVYEYANEKQKQVLKVMESQLNALNDDPIGLTLAQETWFYQMDLLERERIGKQEGISIGKQEGEKNLLIKILKSKFKILSKETCEAIRDATPKTIDQLSEELYHLSDEQDLIAFLQKHLK